MAIGEYTIKNGVCIPKDKITLLAYKGVQNEANRFQAEAKKKLLVCDGKIGKNTLAAVNAVASMFPVTGILGQPATSCRHIADQALPYGGALRAKADQQKLPIVPCPEGIVQRITRPLPKVDALTGEVTYPGGPGGIPWWVYALAAGGGGYYYFTQTKSGKKQWQSLTK
jgi:hypothetical protein